MRPFVNKPTTPKSRISSYACPLSSDSLSNKTHRPASCPGVLQPGTVASIKQCPKVNEMFPRYPRQRMELRWNVNHFHWESLKPSLRIFCSHLTVAHLLRRRARVLLALDLTPRFAFAPFGCDCAALCCSSELVLNVCIFLEKTSCDSENKTSADLKREESSSSWWTDTARRLSQCCLVAGTQAGVANTGYFRH